MNKEPLLEIKKTDPLSEIERTEPGFSTFLKISAVLTGFSQEDLIEMGMHESYYFTIMKEQDQDVVRSFFQRAKEILEGNSPEIGKKIRADFIPKQKIKPGKPAPPLDTLPFQGLAQRIILLWYTGNWTTMNGLEKELEEKKRNEGGRTAAVSAEAYKSGLIWTVAETHPAGARHPGFQSWSVKPF